MRESLKNKTLQDGVAVLLLALALGAYSLTAFLTARVRTSWILSPWLFPLLLAVLALALSAALLREGRRELRRGGAEETPADSAVTRRGKLAAVVLLTAAYLVLMAPIRFIPATALDLAALVFFLGERRWWMIAAVAGLTPLILYALFALGLSVRLP